MHARDSPLEAAAGAAAVAAGAVVAGVSVGVADVWEVTGSPSGLTGVSDSPPEAGAAFGAVALACNSTTPTPSNINTGAAPLENCQRDSFVPHLSVECHLSHCQDQAHSPWQR